MTRTWTHRTWTRYQRTRTWTRTWHLWTWEFRSSPIRVHHLNFLVDIYSLLWTNYGFYILPPGIETTQIVPSVRVSSLIFQRSFSRQEYIPNGNNRDHMIYLITLFYWITVIGQKLSWIPCHNCC
jgi:hypothetical protein